MGLPVLSGTVYCVFHYIALKFNVSFSTEWYSLLFLAVDSIDILFCLPVMRDTVFFNVFQYMALKFIVSSSTEGYSLLCLPVDSSAVYCVFQSVLLPLVIVYGSSGGKRRECCII